GEYSHSFISITGCDSIVNLTLIVNPTYDISSEIEICKGDTYLFEGEELNQSGEYSHSFISITGCDSIVNLTLTVNPTYDISSEIEICLGDTYLFGGEELIQSGEYSHSFISITGCDSIVNLTLIVNPTYNLTDGATICQKEIYQFGNQTLTLPGEYTEIFSSINGCDSIVNLSLNVIYINDSIIKDQNILTVIEDDAEYQWVECGASLMPISGETNKTFTAIQNGYYAVIVKQNDCIDTSDCISVTLIDIIDIKNNTFILYPNPTAGIVNINTNKEYDKIKVSLVNISGQLVLSKEFFNSDSFELNLNNLNNGLYTVLIENNNSIEIYRIQKE
ncbi:MAG: T9SS type A sorting domain-containing protein, partial [Salinivirgaceae bacterium]|nr:T9SS type A sorting domain-containing protein [Salinivirgaceae bacterium]